MAKKEQYFWNKKGETFAGCKFGEEVTAKLEGQDSRIKSYLDLGKIVTSEPVNFDGAKENELNALRKTVEVLDERNKELEKEASKTGSVKLKEAKAEIERLKADLEEATKPAGQ